MLSGSILEPSLLLCSNLLFISRSAANRGCYTCVRIHSAPIKTNTLCNTWGVNWVTERLQGRKQNTVSPRDGCRRKEKKSKLRRSVASFVAMRCRDWKGCFKQWSDPHYISLAELSTLADKLASCSYRMSCFFLLLPFCFVSVPLFFPNFPIRARTFVPECFAAQQPRIICSCWLPQ